MNALSRSKGLLSYGAIFLICFSVFDYWYLRGLESGIIRFAFQYFTLGFGSMTVLLAGWSAAAGSTKSAAARSLTGLVLHFFGSIVFIAVYRLMFFEVPKREVLIAAILYLLSLVVFVALTTRFPKNGD